MAEDGFKLRIIVLVPVLVLVLLNTCNNVTFSEMIDAHCRPLLNHSLNLVHLLVMIATTTDVGLLEQSKIASRSWMLRGSDSSSWPKTS